MPAHPPLAQKELPLSSSSSPLHFASSPSLSRERGVTVWDGNSPSEYVESWLNNADNKRGWSGSQVRLTRLELTDLPHWSLPPPRSQPIHPAPGRAARSRAISRHLGRSRGRAALSRAISERRSRGGTPAQKRKEVGGRRSRPIQSAVVAGFLAPGSSPDGCCAGQQTIGRRDDAPSGTLPPPPGYCRTSALSGGIFPSRFLGPPATPTDFPSPHLRRNHRRDCRRCAPSARSLPV